MFKNLFILNITHHYKLENNNLSNKIIYIIFVSQLISLYIRYYILSDK